jgi:AraC-like DNA-binding protein
MARRHTMARTWTTESVPEPERFAYWREVVCSAFVTLRPERRDREPFAGSVRSARLGPLGVATVASGPQRVLRTEREIGTTPEAAHYLMLQLRGRAAIRQDGREAVLRVGELALVDVLRPYELDFDGPFGQLCFTLPHALLAPRLSAPATLTARRVDGSTAPGRVALAALHAAARSAGDPDGDEAGADALVEHVAGLVALGLRGAAAAPVPTGRAALLQAVLDDVERHLHDPALSPTAVAGRVGVSTRHLHKVVAAQGVTVGRHVTARRLDGCRRDLADPALMYLRIAEVAGRWGFVDPAHFSRAFRRRFGTSPSAVRAVARGR